MPNRRFRRSTLMALCAPLLLAAGCSSTDSPTAPGETRQAAQAVISDQLHNGGTAGFLFLPPMVPRPAQFGDFVPTVEPTVRIDEVTAAGVTLRTLATFTTRGKPWDRVQAITERRPTDRADDPDGYFLVEWDTRRARLSTDARYRVRVLVPAAGGGTRELGFADVDVVGTSQEFRTVDTVNFAPLLNGRTLEIKFRVDRPAVDPDNDSVFDWDDNCPTVANGAGRDRQRDSDRDGIGDACECADVTCPAPPAGSCRLQICDPRSGACSVSPSSVPGGTSCSLPNATAVCTGGACGIVSCNAGSANCNARANDGCETRTNTLTDCGGCGVVCASGAHSTPTCATGTCTLTCATGWADANGSRADGCELDVTTDANCGAAGNACTSTLGATSTCVGGSCSTIACATNRANCNTTVSDGCEVSLAGDVANCGACDHACAVTNAAPACVAGQCAVGTCAAGFANCDGSAANGCEVTPASDAANCGGCGHACSLANASPVCAAGACAVGACAAGYADCDGVAANGCEVALAANAAHCGACGSVCSLTHATAVCAAGACAIGACGVGFANCDADAATGCETDLATVTSCGACGTVCASGAHSTPTCGAGSCGLACETGFANCDGNAANGCEVDTTTDGAHCGACGTSCTNATTCQSGACSTAVCAAGHADCNALATDGCETTPATDSGHCGACGHACSFANAAPVCTEGACGFTVCDMGYGDCDGNAANGCEVALGTDANHCGGCGVSCTYAHATGVCGNSLCALGTCDAGWADCDGHATNGCEVHLTADLAHCGTCGTTCSAPANATATCGGSCGFACDATHADCDGHAANGCEAAVTTDGANCGACGNVCTAGRACVAGACSASACVGTLANCNGDEGDGCEVATTTDAAHCGACGHACSFANATASCAASACVLGACAPGFANCDGNAANGCEVAVTTDAANCGACGTACATANGTAACVTGTCGVGSCDAHFADCDHLAGNGCEVSTATDTGHCGGCGTSCPSPSSAVATCAASVCGYACAPGQEDCDGNAANGCEVDANADRANCGGCGVVCTLGRTCQSGACTTAVCTAGLADCDHDAANGCEVALASNAANCGVCGTACTYANGAGVCTLGACSLGSCAAGFANCNAASADGCETGTQSNVANCGLCGLACATPNGTPACYAGACGIAACNSGFALGGGACVDVDECAIANGGCSADATCTNTVGGRTCACRAGYAGDGLTCADINECATGNGGCSANATCTNTAGSRVCACSAGYAGNGVTCADVNECATNNGGCGGNMTCANTAGSFSCACGQGFADCDGNAANGCERNVTADRSNCGACGRVCGVIQACVAGVCGQRSCAVAGTPGCGLVVIAGGPTFTVGSSAISSFYGGSPEQPGIAVSSYALDAYEVTVARFNAWWSVRSRDLAAVRAAPIAYPGSNAIAWGAAAVAPGAQSASLNWSPASTTRDAHPMNAVSYWAAQEFCVWDGGRLPTEAEWEFAARGRAVPSEGLVSGRLYPWGNTPPSLSCDRALWRNCGGSDGGGTRRVGSFPTGDSGALHDMAGNVYEWMADTFQAYRPSWSSNLDPLSNISPTADRIARGGSWGDTDPQGLLSLARFTVPPQLNDNPYIGFRCARALP